MPQGDVRLVGNPPQNFTGECAQASQWMLDLENYHFLNRMSPIISDETNRVALALTLIRGPAVDGWARQCMKWLQQLSRNNVQDAHPWESFKQWFLLNYADVTAVQKAQQDIRHLRMVDNKADDYIVKFKQLANDARYMFKDPAILGYFWAGLPKGLLKSCLESDRVPNNFEEWKDLVRRKAINYNIICSILGNRESNR